MIRHPFTTHFDMHFDEANQGDYRIHAGALQSKGRYVAAGVVSRLRGSVDLPREAFRDTAISGGLRWADPPSR